MSHLTLATIDGVLRIVSHLTLATIDGVLREGLVETKLDLGCLQSTDDLKATPVSVFLPLLPDVDTMSDGTHYLVHTCHTRWLTEDYSSQRSHRMGLLVLLTPDNTNLFQMA